MQLAYIASYIARSKFITLTMARLCLTIMTHWIHEYIDGCSPDNMKPDVKFHGPFFSLCQAVFYVFVFRHKALLESPDGLKFSRQLNFERVISSRLNPLKVCLPTVVEVFASITNHHEIVFCYSILEQNKRLVLSSVTPTTTSEEKTQLEAVNILDCFFPFDPYHLKRSSEFIQPLYQEWEEVELMEMDDDHSSSLPDGTNLSAVPTSLDSSLSHSYSMSTISPH